MKMSKFTPKARAMREVFFSILMLVAPQPDSNAAYSARKEADSLKQHLSSDLSISQVLKVIILIDVSGDKEDVFLLADFKEMSWFLVTMMTLGIVPLDGPEYKCAQQHSGYYAPYNHWMVHFLFAFNFRQN